MAKTFRPLIERLLVDQIQEAGWFVSLMGRLVETYPDWAEGVISAQPQIPDETRGRFRSLVTRVRREDSSTGRPALIDPAETASR